MFHNHNPARMMCNAAHCPNSLNMLAILATFGNGLVSVTAFTETLQIGPVQPQGIIFAVKPTNVVYFRRRYESLNSFAVLTQGINLQLDFPEAIQL